MKITKPVSYTMEWRKMRWNVLKFSNMIINNTITIYYNSYNVFQRRVTRDWASVCRIDVPNEISARVVI